jgi:hypothetical protein
MKGVDNLTNPENFSSELNTRITALREASLISMDRLSALNDAVHKFDDSLKSALSAEFGDPRLRKLIPEWHRLVGSTVEVHAVDQEIRRFILAKLELFVEHFEAEWDI